MQTPDRIAESLFGKARRRVLGLLFGQPDESFYLRQIARKTNLAVRGVQLELENLVEAGLITRSQEGRQVYFQADHASPVFVELSALMEKTLGLADPIRTALLPLQERGDISVAFIFGSVAAGEHTAGSDVDVMVVGDARLRDVAPALRPVQDRIGREINPTVYPADEFRRRLADDDPFLTRVLDGPRIMLIGSEDDVEDLGGEPLVENP